MNPEARIRDLMEALDRSKASERVTVNRLLLYQAKQEIEHLLHRVTVLETERALGDEAGAPAPKASEVSVLRHGPVSATVIAYGSGGSGHGTFIPQAPPAANSIAVIEALNFYAEQGRLCRLTHSGGDAGRLALDADGGHKARAALAALAEQAPPAAVPSDIETILARHAVPSKYWERVKAAMLAAIAPQAPPAARLNECPACKKNWGEHRPGYSASACKQAPPAAVAGPLSEEALLTRIKELQDANAELERLCEATYVQQGADAYNHATDILTDWQEARVAAGLDPGAQMSLCDGLGRLIQMLEEAEAKQAPPAAGAASNPWRPIETAPTDGTTFLVYLPKEKRNPVQTAWQNQNGVMVIGSSFAFDLSSPTLWMSLDPMLAAASKENNND